MRDIQTPNAGGTQRLVNATGANGSNTQPPRNIVPSDQARKYAVPDPRREYFQPKKSNGNKYLAIGLFLSLIIIGIIFFLASFIFDGATLSLKPLKKDIAISETYVVSELDRKDLLQLQNVPDTEEITIRKKVSKKVSRKATGEVTLYNDFSKDEQKFVKGTRLATTDGKIFKLDSNVIVPGKSGETPGSIVTTVQADQEGVEYNVAPTKFVVPGLKASPKYKFFYAESKTAMEGGIVGTVNDASEVDIAKGRDDLKDKVSAALGKKLGSNVPEGFVYNPDMLLTVLGKMQKIREDDETATYGLNATGTALYFKRDEIVKKIIDQQNSNSNSKPIVKILSTKDFTVSVLDQKEVLDETGPLKMVLTGSAPVVFYPDKQAILEYYAGKPVSEFNDIVKKFQFIESASRVVRPFWNTTFPTNISKIKVNFEE